MTLAKSTAGSLLMRPRHVLLHPQVFLDGFDQVLILHLFAVLDGKHMLTTIHFVTGLLAGGLQFLGMLLSMFTQAYQIGVRGLIFIVHV